MAGDESGAALAAIDEEEVAEAVAVKKPMEEMCGEMESIGTEGLVPVIISRDYQVVPSLGHKVVAPTCACHTKFETICKQ